MPTLDAERRTIPRSVLRYRPVDTGQTVAVPIVSRAHRSRPDVYIPTSMHPGKFDQTQEQTLPSVCPNSPESHRRPTSFSSQRHLFHPLFFVSIGLLLTLFLWLGAAKIMNWSRNEINAIQYGYPRTFQIDVVVGQGDSVQHPSHFIAINLHGRVTIIDFPAGDPSRAWKMVSSSIPGPDADLAVVILRFIDVNHNGMPDMIVEGGGIQSILINDGKTFRPPTSAEETQLMHYLWQYSQS